MDNNVFNKDNLDKIMTLATMDLAKETKDESLVVKLTASKLALRIYGLDSLEDLDESTNSVVNQMYAQISAGLKKHNAGGTDHED